VGVQKKRTHVPKFGPLQRGKRGGLGPRFGSEKHGGSENRIFFFFFFFVCRVSQGTFSISTKAPGLKKPLEKKLAARAFWRARAILVFPGGEGGGGRKNG